MVQIKPGETLTGKDRIQYIKDTTKARNDPVWFMKEKLGWKTMFKMQEEITRTFYQNLYNPNLQEYKKLIGKIGQRCKSGDSLILTNSGYVRLDSLYIDDVKIEGIFKPLKNIKVYNGSDWTNADSIIYCGKKHLYTLKTNNGFETSGSKDHKYRIHNGNKYEWKKFSELSVGDIIETYIIDPKDITPTIQYSVVIELIEHIDLMVDMYDLYVPSGNCYVSDGVLSHNSGKSALGAKLCGFEFFKLLSLEDPAQYYGLMKNQKISVNCVAASKKQATDNLFGIFLTDFQENEWIQQWFNLKTVGDERIECRDKHVFAEVAAARIDTGASTGATSAAVFGDEVDLWHNQTLSKLSASLVWSKMINSTQSLGIKGKCFAFSSVQDENGLINQLYNEGVNEPTTLAYDLCTWEMNDRITKEDLLEEYKYKMDMFWRDFANQPSASSAYLFPGDSLKLNKSQYNIFEIGEVPEESAQHYHVMAVDPAFRNDSFGIATGYKDGDWIIVDGIHKFQKDANSEVPYVKPSEVEEFILRWISALNVDTFYFDVDLILSTVERLERDHGITCIKRIAGEETYSKWVNLNDGIGEYHLSIPHNEFLLRECRHLTKNELPSGKIRIDHPKTKTGSKDLADAVSQVIWHLASQDTQSIQIPIGYMAPMSI